MTILTAIAIYLLVALPLGVVVGKRLAVCNEIPTSSAKAERDVWQPDYRRSE